MEKNNENKTCCQKHGKGIVVILGMLILASIVIVSILRDRLVFQETRQVAITGQGRVSYNPDIAVINLGVQINKAKTAEEALNQLNSKMTSIIEAVKKEGVVDADIQTENYNLSPQIEYRNDGVASTTGYNANQQLNIKIRDFDQNKEKLNKVIGAAGKAGTNQINNLSFDSSRLNDLKQEARLLAIKDAKEKSFSMAEAAGVKIRNIASWYENLVQPQTNGSVAYGMGGVNDYSKCYSPQVVEGSREVVVEVIINYNIK